MQQPPNDDSVSARYSRLIDFLPGVEPAHVPVRLLDSSTLPIARFAPKVHPGHSRSGFQRCSKRLIPTQVLSITTRHERNMEPDDLRVPHHDAALSGEKFNEGTDLSYSSSSSSSQIPLHPSSIPSAAESPVLTSQPQWILLVERALHSVSTPRCLAQHSWSRFAHAWIGATSR